MHAGYAVGVGVDTLGKGVGLVQGGLSEWNGCIVRTHLPMKLKLKLTLSLSFSMAGTTSSCRQAFASGHLDMMCASSETFCVVFTPEVRGISSPMILCWPVMPGVARYGRRERMNAQVASRTHIPMQRPRRVRSRRHEIKVGCHSGCNCSSCELRDLYASSKRCFSSIVCAGIVATSAAFEAV